MARGRWNRLSRQPHQCRRAHRRPSLHHRSGRGHGVVAAAPGRRFARTFARALLQQRGRRPPPGRSDGGGVAGHGHGAGAGSRLRHPVEQRRRDVPAQRRRRRRRRCLCARAVPGSHRRQRLVQHGPADASHARRPRDRISPAPLTRRTAGSLAAVPAGAGFRTHGQFFAGDRERAPRDPAQAGRAPLLRSAGAAVPTGRRLHPCPLGAGERTGVELGRDQAEVPRRARPPAGNVHPVIQVLPSGRTTSAIPPSTATPATSSRGVSASPRNAMPPMAASSGTLNCTVAALVARSSGNTEYQTAYPSPDASAPDAIAYAMPTRSSTPCRASSIRTTAAGTVRRKFPAVTQVASPAPRPRSEYTPQAIPADSIKPAPIGGGAEMPGSSNPTSPVSANTNPTSFQPRSRSPRHSPWPTIATWTAPKSNSAPVAAVRLT